MNEHSPSDGSEISPGLFRPEAIDANSSRFGVPVKTIGVAGWVLTSFMLAIVFVAAFFLATANYARKETVIGTLTPTAGAQRLTAVRAGVVDEVLAREGQAVTAGTPLISLSFDSTVEGGEGLGALLQEAARDESSALAFQQSAQTATIDSQLQELAARRAGIVDRRAQLTVDRDLQTQRIGLAQETVEAARSLFDRQLIAALPMRQREEALLTARQQLGAIDRDLLDLASQITQIDAQRRRLAAERAQGAAQVAQSVARLSERQATLLGQRGQVLTARTGGRVAALSVRPAMPVQPGQTLAIVLPEGAGLEAELWVPSRAVGFVRAGDRVRIMFDSFPYQRFGVGRGRVKLVTRSPTQPSELPTPIETKEPLYRVLVTLDRQDVHAYGHAWALAPGMRVTADLVLDNRPLAAWLFDPVLAARARR